jgi:hypothetical protein
LRDFAQAAKLQRRTAWAKQAGEAVQIVRALPRLLSTIQVIAIDRIYLKVISPD